MAGLEASVLKTVDRTVVPSGRVMAHSWPLCQLDTAGQKVGLTGTRRGEQGDAQLLWNFLTGEGAVASTEQTRAEHLLGLQGGSETLFCSWSQKRIPG